ncbi:hypothetical protein [Nocardia brasiliensis]|uniref:hypothetical protein n=1 Tax=Nocardia brasiliensis TaxID=37326 RepID=UPI0024561734|nr:hypothetical protein [Nocardia brasiliensis]
MTQHSDLGEDMSTSDAAAGPGGRARLPWVPDTVDEQGYRLDGRDWASLLEAITAWYVVAGTDELVYGEWPYRIVAYYDHPEGELFGAVVFTEGDLDTQAFPTREARHDAIARRHGRPHPIEANTEKGAL